MLLGGTWGLERDGSEISFEEVAPSARGDPVRRDISGVSCVAVAVILINPEARILHHAMSERAGVSLLRGDMGVRHE